MIPQHLSYSQISDILQCGTKFQLARKYNAPKNPACYLVGGTVVHAVTHMVDVGWPDLDVTGDEIVELCRKHFGIEVAKNMETEPDTGLWQSGGRGGVEDLTWWYDKAPEFVANWVAFRRDTDLKVVTLRDGNLASECEMTIQYAGKPFKLAVDRVMYSPTTGAHAIVDIKTGSREPTSPFQLAFYRDAMQMVHGVKARWGYYWLARTGKLSRPFDLDRIPYTMTSDLAAKAKKMIELELFMPNPGMLCGTCEVRAYCQTMGGDPTLLEGYPRYADH